MNAKVIWGIGALVLFLSADAVQADATTIYGYSGAQTTVTLNPGTYNITAYGAQGGLVQFSSWRGGLGAEMEAQFNFTTVTTLTILVGGFGSYGWAGFYAGGGGGGSFVVTGTTPLVIAGGGGGGSINGGANGRDGVTGTSGGGYYGGTGGTNGSNNQVMGDGAGGGGFYGYGFLTAVNTGAGGYGGGGAVGYNGSYGVGAGGGGGYSGGEGGSNYAFGYGGGSFINASGTILSEVSGVASPDASPNGEVIITETPEPATMGMLAAGLAALVTRRRRASE